MSDCVEAIVGLRRADGTIKWVRVPEEHIERVAALATGPIADPTIILDGQRPAEK